MKMATFLPLVAYIILLLTSVTALSVGTNMPTIYYEPESIETGSHQFLVTDNSSPTVNFREDFTITFLRLHLQARSDYYVSVGSNSIEATTIVGGYTHMGMNFHSRLVTSITLFVTSTLRSSFTSLRINYLAYSKILSTQQKIYTEYFTTTGDPNMVCDGRFMAASCYFLRSFAPAIPNTNYRIFIQLLRFQFITNPNGLLIPYFKVDVSLPSTSVVQIMYTGQYVLVYAVSLHVTFIRNDLFDLTQRTDLIFSYAAISKTNPSASTTFPISFSHYVFHRNFIFSITSHLGRQFDFGIEPNNPLDKDLSLKLNILGNMLEGNVLAYFGYTDTCPSYFTMNCLQCPKNCKTCDMLPVFHCEECMDGFMLSSDKLSCSCSLVTVGDLCGNFPQGCNIAKIEPVTGNQVCVTCDMSKKLTLSGSDCICQPGYIFDLTNTCQDLCGDGILIDLQCDDGNTVSGDGCSSKCLLETGFTCDATTNPTFCRSEILLRYNISLIMKNQLQNSATIILKPINKQTLPFTIKEQNFHPLASYISFRIFTSTNQQILIKDFSLIEITQAKEIKLQFPFETSVQGFKGLIVLNYGKTQYKDDTQKLQFVLRGDNYALRVTNNIAAFKSIKYGMLAGVILSALSLIVGFLTSKFIGIQSILTLQLIYYSQLLIFDVSRWPPGFTYLKYLNYASGFNDAFQFTDYQLLTPLTKKLHVLGIKKLSVENFNVNFAILMLVFLTLLFISIIRHHKQKSLINDQSTTIKSIVQPNTNSNPTKSGFTQLKNLNKVTLGLYQVANQISLWLVLPLISSLTGQFFVSNSQFTFVQSSFEGLFLVKSRAIFVIVGFSVIFLVSLNNVNNIWLSQSCFNRLMERPEEMTYKTVLFSYLLVIGCMICFFNSQKLGQIYTSIIALVLQIILIVLLIKIQPYKQSLKVHTVGLFFNHGMVLVFFMVVNLINYVQNLNQIVILAFGFFLTAGSAMTLCMTFVRFYYELRYGKELEDKIMDEKQQQRLREELEKKRMLKNHEQMLYDQLQMQKSQKQKIRDMNPYLYENQQKQENKLEYFDWIQTRLWDQKLKDKQFFVNFDEKPESWLKIHDQQKYQKKLLAIQRQKAKQRSKKQEITKDPEFQRTVSKLKKEVQNIRKKVGVS